MKVNVQVTCEREDHSGYEFTVYGVDSTAKLWNEIDRVFEAVGMSLVQFERVSLTIIKVVPAL